MYPDDDLFPIKGPRCNHESLEKIASIRGKARGPA